ncbi:hypothetical protein [Dickeya zeae]|uniref:hypothetical protein n=1 Tax=Dickeya zeae TaxID=204042 RepID=UPI001CF4FE09|nr:hypothetical protein [Dickeya zeae]MCA6985460.1 hypothetical protein [Dickeya zeae]
MTRSDIFKMAWGDARYAAFKHGGKPKEYISACLKKVYVITRINAVSWEQKEYAAENQKKRGLLSSLYLKRLVNL